MLPIRNARAPHPDNVSGFLGRRNPTKDDDDYAGPKYLNTKTTPAFTKGESLFGYAESRTHLDRGALPVLVEGPMDALAVTIASHNAAIGVAPMGTALTTGQVKQLLSHVRLANGGRSRIAVATDADAAGWRAAQVAYWLLTAADLDPSYVRLPQGLDPSSLLAAHGAAALDKAIELREPLADLLVDQTLRQSGAWSDPAVRRELVTEVAQVAAVRGADAWATTLSGLQRQLHVAPGLLEHITLSESVARDQDRFRYAQSRIAGIQTHGRVTGAATHDAHPSRPASTPQRPRRGALVETRTDELQRLSERSHSQGPSPEAPHR
jgi:DNA primase